MPGLYIHIPYCRRRCNYCDFYFITNQKLVSDFTSALLNEIVLASRIYQPNEVNTIYFGGGTPSVLTPDQLNAILSQLFSKFNINSECEITLEANPEDVSASILKEYKCSGINRLSLGIQSFKDYELNFLTRTHTGKQAEQTLENAVNIIGNVNTDIIYSLPGQTKEDIFYNLSNAYRLGSKHISPYTLTYEHGTLLFKNYLKGNITKTSIDAEADMYLYVSEALQSVGYTHYEVSNFALPGFESKHNLNYWNRGNYIGFGPSAHSLFDNERWNNVKSMGRYISDLNESKLPTENHEVINLSSQKNEYIMLSLRSTGINYGEFKALFNEDFEFRNEKLINELIIKGMAKSTNGRFNLTSKGFVLADEIASKFIHKFESINAAIERKTVIPTTS